MTPSWYWSTRIISYQHKAPDPFGEVCLASCSRLGPGCQAKHTMCKHSIHGPQLLRSTLVCTFHSQFIILYKGYHWTNFVYVPHPASTTKHAFFSSILEVFSLSFKLVVLYLSLIPRWTYKRWDKLRLRSIWFTTI